MFLCVILLASDARGAVCIVLKLDADPSALPDRTCAYGMFATI